MFVSAHCLSQTSAAQVRQANFHNITDFGCTTYKRRTTKAVQKRGRMNIAKLQTPEQNYCYAQGKTKVPVSGGQSHSDPEDVTQMLSGCFSSPAEKYQELSGNRDQMLQELGLHYIDPSKCTWKEFQELCGQVLNRTEYNAGALDDLPISVADESEEMNCLNYLSNWSEQEAGRGNMVGYHMGCRLYDAIFNYSLDIQGKTQYIEYNGKEVKVWNSIDNTFLKSPLLGSTFATSDTGGLLSFDASYADDSTADNPIIRINACDEDGNIQEVYRIVLSQVDPRNATQLEIFALCVHRDKQGIGSLQGHYNGSSYQFCRDLGLFPETSGEEFTKTRRNWIQALDDKIGEIQTLLESAAAKQLKLKYSIGNLTLTGKEWQELLDRLKESRSQIDLEDEETEQLDN